MPEEGMGLDHRGVHLVRELARQLVGELAEHRDAALLDGPLLLPCLVLDEAEHAEGQVRGYVPLVEVAAELPELLLLVVLHLPDDGHGGRDGAHDRGERHHGEKEDHDRVAPLEDVPRDDVHGGRRELRDAPVKCGQILVAPLSLLEAVVSNPSVQVRIQADAHKVPSASDVVVDHQQQEDHFHDVRDDACVLGVNQVVDVAQGLPQLEQPQQPHHAHEPQDPEEPHGAPGAPLVLANAGQAEGPIRHHHHEVHHEPRFHIVDCNLLGGHDCHAILDVAHEERAKHVQCPEDQREPLDGNRAVRLGRFKDLDWDQEQVVEDEHGADQVPDHPYRAAGVGDQALRAAALHLRQLQWGAGVVADERGRR
mmetsp:Transcript_15701/g.49679  ORF Transcript_15701/g.49679 Transcript_15701/m.49679 type:complete len:367 (-) Transcript_15701:693-1793(-)